MTTTRKNQTSRRTRRRPRLRVLQGGTGVRAGRIQSARARIASGYYERDDIQNAVAAALLEELHRK